MADKGEVKIEDILNMDVTKDQMASEVIAAMNAKHPMERLHLISHLMEKLEDPNKVITCSPEMEELCNLCIRIYGPDRTKVIIEEITPSDQDMALMMILEAFNMSQMNRRNGRMH